MKLLLLKSYSFIFLFLSLLSCSEAHKQVGDCPVINVEKSIDEKNYSVQRLSDYAQKIVYIPLETSDSSLVQLSEGILLENGRLFIDSNNNDCLSFAEKDGSFLGRIGRLGEGPEEFLTIRGMDISQDGKRILISSVKRGLEYSIDGKFIRDIKFPEVEDYTAYSVAYLSNNLFFYSFISWKTPEYESCIATDSGVVKQIFKEYQPIIKTENSVFSFMEIADISHVGNTLHSYRRRSDTIYAIDGIGNREPVYVVNLGKYKSSFKDEKELEDEFNGKKIPVIGYLESNQYSFFRFWFGQYAPEPFEETNYNSKGEKRTLVNTVVYGIYNKETGSMILLNLPSPGNQGLLNDLDGGPAFWPQYISKDGKMAMLIDAEKFIEACENIKKPSPEIKKVLDRLGLEDNPVLVVAY